MGATSDDAWSSELRAVRAELDALRRERREEIASRLEEDETVWPPAGVEQPSLEENMAELRRVTRQMMEELEASERYEARVDALERRVVALERSYAQKQR